MIWTLEAVREHAKEVYDKWDGDLGGGYVQTAMSAQRLLHFLDKVEEELANIKDE